VIIPVAFSAESNITGILDDGVSNGVSVMLDEAVSGGVVIITDNALFGSGGVSVILDDDVVSLLVTTVALIEVIISDCTLFSLAEEDVSVLGLH
jgi:hypothetical protein